MRTLILLFLLFVIACNSTATRGKITVFKSPECGCCVGWASYARQQGFEVETLVANMDQLKIQYQIPKNMESCHTTLIEDYFVEGHVPIEAINKLLAEKPDIDGIALPRMPSGTPGMPGPKRGDWVIYALKDGQYSEYMRI